MHGLHLALPGVFMGVNNVKTPARGPPCGRGVPELVQPARFAQGHGNGVVSHARRVVPYLLRKHMDLVALRELLDQRNRIPLCPTPGRIKNAVQHGYTQPARGLRLDEQSVHVRSRSS